MLPEEKKSKEAKDAAKQEHEATKDAAKQERDLAKDSKESGTEITKAEYTGLPRKLSTDPVQVQTAEVKKAQREKYNGPDDIGLTTETEASRLERLGGGSKLVQRTFDADTNPTGTNQGVINVQS